MSLIDKRLGIGGMTLASKQSIRSATALLVFWLALSVAIQICHERILFLAGKNSAHTTAGADFIPAASVLKPISLGYDQLLADLWWLSFIQYYGDSRARALDHYALAYKYLDLVTQLDPKFVQLYWFSAFAIGCDNKRPQLAAALIERGIESNQDNWYLPFIAGINQYLFAQNETAAAKYYRIAAKFPDAPSWLERQAAIIEAHMPSLLKEINTWANIYNSSQEALVKRKAALQLRSLWLTVYTTVPSLAAKQRAKSELKALGFDTQGREVK